MANLVGLYESLGFTAVANYIQSGNVMFEAADKAAPDARSVEKISRTNSVLMFRLLSEAKANSRIRFLAIRFQASPEQTQITCTSPFWNQNPTRKD